MFINFHLPATKLSHLHFTRYFELPPLMGPWEQQYFRKFIFPSTLSPPHSPPLVPSGDQGQWVSRRADITGQQKVQQVQALVRTHWLIHVRLIMGILTSQLFLINLLIFPNFCPQFPLHPLLMCCPHFSFIFSLIHLFSYILFSTYYIPGFVNIPILQLFPQDTHSLDAMYQKEI